MVMAAASATAGFPALVVAADDNSSDAPRRDVIARLTMEDAKFLVGSEFLVQASAGTLHFICVEVKPVPQQGTASAATAQAFSMRFRSQSSTSLKQGTYSFEHPVLGPFRLFIVPSGPGMTPRRYTAIINHSSS